ncbi:MAG: DUF1653 domain-containing protein [Candidatus Andersenbacteria bacterium]
MSSQSEDSQKDKAQAELQTLPIKIGDIYVHYKAHGTYEVINIAVKEDTLEPLIIYRAIGHGGTVWARTYSDWNADVEMNGQTVKRFTKK